MEPENQLNLLNAQAKSIQPRLNKIYSLYLQILRDSLSNSIKKTILEIITSTNNELSQLPKLKDQQNVQFNVNQILTNSNKLLTLGNLLDLSNDIDKENDTILQKVKANNNTKNNNSNKNNSIPLNSNDKNSIKLGLSLPLESRINIEPWFQKNEEQYPANNAYLNNNQIIKEEILDDELIEDNIAEQDFIDEEIIDEEIVGEEIVGEEIVGEEIVGEEIVGEEIVGEEINNEQMVKEKSILIDIKNNYKKSNRDIFKSIFNIARKTISKNPINGSATKPVQDDSLKPPESEVDLNNYKSPEELLSWLIKLEKGLNHCLVNLSHLINIELLKSGIITTFIPINLLDAVLTGQINTLDSPTNILRISLPVNDPKTGNIIDITCLFVTPSELEFDNFRLRQCRIRVNQYKKLLIKLSKKQRYWNGRVLENHLRKEWWDDDPKKF